MRIMTKKNNSSYFLINQYMIYIYIYIYIGLLYTKKEGIAIPSCTIPKI